jgi:hypothetical protein
MRRRGDAAPRTAAFLWKSEFGRRKFTLKVSFECSFAVVSGTNTTNSIHRKGDRWMGGSGRGGKHELERDSKRGLASLTTKE